VINPATEEVAGVIAMGSAEDVNRAASAARRAFDSYSRTSAAERRALLERILVAYKARYDEIAQAISDEMGAPISLARQAQAGIGIGHLTAMIEVLEHFQFEERRGKTRLAYEPVGVCGLITPWNWPINQVAAKVVPALAAGCTMVLKPSEFSPFSAILWAHALHEAGVPPGVFNLINGTGPVVGAALASHPDIDMISFTGSTRAGTEVARHAASSVKRVHQELGGKSPNVLLDDVDFEKAVTASVSHVMRNTGQSCNAPTRMLVPADKLATVEAIAKRAAESTVVADVHNDMKIAREEIFGPVLCILPYESEEEAIRIANDTPYGLAAYVWAQDPKRARAVAGRIRAGQVLINGAQGDMHTPFGGFKQSGNGREWGEHGLRDFLEIKAIVGAEAASA
jgi:aldehyde dehydrogenase (NAD+)